MVNVTQLGYEDMMIDHQVSTGENVTLVVDDMLGRKVRTLQDGPLSAGTYELKWDAKTDNGAELASGTYLLRLQAKRQQQIIKMLLMK